MARRKTVVYIPVQCPYCHCTAVIKAGKHATGAQRYRCQNEQCARRILLLQYRDRGRVPEIRRRVVALALNGSGIRATARVLRISSATVIALLKRGLQHYVESTSRSQGASGEHVAAHQLGIELPRRKLI
jgi:transposase-like protein